MKKLERLKLYYQLFLLMAQNPKISLKRIAKYYGHSGRGKSLSTYSWHIQNMFNKKISKEPIIVLKSYENTHVTSYLCEYQYDKALHDLIEKLTKDQEICYAIAMSSKKLFITSTSKDINIEKYGLNVDEKSILYTPIYPIP